MTGTVKNIVTDKRFFFVRGEDGVDRFAHVSECEASVNFDVLQKNDVVEFDHVDAERGPRAVKIRKPGVK